jgi:hypothetical protein
MLEIKYKRVQLISEHSKSERVACLSVCVTDKKVRSCFPAVFHIVLKHFVGLLKRSESQSC